MTVSQSYADFQAYVTANPRAFEVLGSTYLTNDALGNALISLAGTTNSYTTSVKVINLSADNLNHFLAWADQVCGC